MPYRNKEVQPELFSNIGKTKEENIFKKSLNSISIYRSTITISFDNLVVIIITLLMIDLLLFVFGIERGKLLAKINNETPQLINTTSKIKAENNTTINPAATGTQENITNKLIEKEQNVPEEKTLKQNTEPVVTATAEKYTIQLATYKDNNIAKKEIEELKANGLKCFVIKKGNYFVIYSGTYNDKKTARKSLDRFKKQYKDCFVSVFKR